MCREVNQHLFARVLRAFASSFSSSSSVTPRCIRSGIISLIRQLSSHLLYLSPGEPVRLYHALAATSMFFLGQLCSDVGSPHQATWRDARPLVRTLPGSCQILAPSSSSSWSCPLLWSLLFRHHHRHALRCQRQDSGHGRARRARTEQKNSCLLLGLAASYVCQCSRSLAG